MVALMQSSTAGGRSIGAIDRTQPKQEFSTVFGLKKIREKETRFTLYRVNE